MTNLSSIAALRRRARTHIEDGAVTPSYSADRTTHSEEEQGHADQIAGRIVQLGGEPNLDPEGLHLRSHAQYIAGEGLEDMIREDLIAERIAIESYREMIEYMTSRDPTTRRMLEEILANEEEHAEDLSSMIENLGELLPSKKPIANDAPVARAVK